MSPANSLSFFLLAYKCRTFKKRGISRDVTEQWFERFDKQDHPLARKFLRFVKFFPTDKVDQFIISKGNELLAFFASEDIQASNVLVVQIDEAGSSAARIATTFRKNVRGALKCHFKYAEDWAGISKVATENDIKAVIYVDDFIGTGDQILEARSSVVSALGYQLAEHVLVFATLEEAREKLSTECNLVYAYAHEKVIRPLREECVHFSADEKRVLHLINWRVTVDDPLGHGECSSMVVLGDGIPDNSPALLSKALFAQY